MSRLELACKDASLKNGVEKIVAASKDSQSPTVSWLGKLIAGSIKHRGGEDRAYDHGGPVSQRQDLYNDYFLRLVDQQLQDIGLVRKKALQTQAAKGFHQTTVSFMSSKPNAIRYLPEKKREDASAIFVECIKRWLLPQAVEVLQTWEKLHGLSEKDRGLISTLKNNHCLFNDFKPKVPAWRTFGTSAPLIIPTNEAWQLKNSGLAAGASALLGTPISIDELKKVLEDVPLVVLDANFCGEQVKRIRQELFYAGNDVRVGLAQLKSLAEAFNKAIRFVRNNFGAENNLDQETLQALNALEEIISPSDNQPAVHQR